jgi:hypothetical protein
MSILVPIAAYVPALVAAAGDRTQTRFWEFSVFNMRKPHRRRAYGRMMSLAPRLADGRHCEEKSDEAIQSAHHSWIASRVASGAREAMTAPVMVSV